MTTLPPLPADFGPTRATLHAYALAMGAIPRAHAERHDKWWHAGLTVVRVGLQTAPVPLPNGRSALLTMDLTEHEVRVDAGDGAVTGHSMLGGSTATQLADALIADATALGLGDDYERDKFENDEVPIYDPEVATAFLETLTAVHALMEDHRRSLTGDVGPIHLWPHGFDVSFEWFGSRVETYEENGQVTEYPAQLNFGWDPNGDGYFYSNPWPFEGEELLSKELPAPASWHTEGWEGSMLPYVDVAGRADGAEVVRAYARRVFELALPTLTV